MKLKSIRAKLFQEGTEWSEGRLGYHSKSIAKFRNQITDKVLSRICSRPLIVGTTALVQFYSNVPLGLRHHCNRALAIALRMRNTTIAGTSVSEVPRPKHRIVIQVYPTCCSPN